jgi:outer membrane protein
VTRTDVSQAESRVERARADRAAALGDLESSRANVQRLVGVGFGEMEAADPLEGLPGSKEEAVDLAARSNPNVLAAEFDRLAAERQVREVQGELLPTVSLDGSVERGDELTNPGAEREEVSIIARVTVPLYQQGAVYSRVREAKQVLQQAQSAVDNQRRVAVETAASSWENLVSSRAEIVARRAQVESAELALDGVRREQEVGSRTVLDVLDAEQELLDARVNLVRAERDLVVASYELKAATGQLTAFDLGLPVTLYDFDEHYREVRNQWWGTEP